MEHTRAALTNPPSSAFCCRCETVHVGDDRAEERLGGRHGGPGPTPGAGERVTPIIFHPEASVTPTHLQDRRRDDGKRLNIPLFCFVLFVRSVVFCIATGTGARLWSSWSATRRRSLTWTTTPSVTTSGPWTTESFSPSQVHLLNSKPHPPTSPFLMLYLKKITELPR